MDTPGRTPRWTRAEYDRLVERGILHEDERVELIAGQILVKGRYPVVERGWTRAEYERLVAGGLLPARGAVELVGGALVCAEPQGSWHAAAVDLAADALRLAIGAGWAIRVEKPLALGDESEPEPDVAVVAGAHRDYRDAHPATAALVVEVSESSLDADRAHKGSLYARAGVPEYWIVNLANGTVEVYRAPTPDAAASLGWRYREREVVGSADAISPLAVPAARVLIADLLP